jgi:hypothetical protein
MSTIQNLLQIAHDVAFTNLFDVTVGASESAKEAFSLRLESINFDGMGIDYTLNEATKQHMITKVHKAKTITLRVRETRGFYFYKYLLDWFLNFYDYKNNRFVSGTLDNTKEPIAGATKGTIVKNRTITIRAYGNELTEETTQTNLYIEIRSAKIQRLPNLSFDYKTSAPIVYDVSFVCDDYDILADGLNIGDINLASTLPLKHPIK